MKKIIVAINIVALAALITGCTSTQVVSKGNDAGYTPIRGWGSSIDPPETKGQGGYYNSVFFY